MLTLYVQAQQNWLYWKSGHSNCNVYVGQPFYHSHLQKKYEFISTFTTAPTKFQKSVMNSEFLGTF